MGKMRMYARVSGVVQGVGFRYYTQRMAQRLGLVGYVRNLRDGGVELEAEGEAHDVAALVSAVQKGPAGARVRALYSDERPLCGTETDFEIRF